MKQKNITNTIQDLLLEYNYVIIPDLGGFVSKYESAKIISRNNIIQAPSIHISFNSSLKEDDGLLINRYAKQFSISIDKAKLDVKEYVKNIFFKLDEGQFVVFDKIGKLKFNQQLNIEFHTDHTDNYNAYSYGLVNVACVALNDNEIVSSKNRLLFTKSTLKKVAVIIPFLVVGLILSMYLNKIDFFSSKIGQQASVVSSLIDQPESHISKIEDASSISAQIDYKTNKKNALAYTEEKNGIDLEEKVTVEKNDNAIVVELEKEKAPVEIIKDVPEKIESSIKLIKQNKFQLVAGSFKSKKNAERLAKKIQKLDFESNVVKSGSKYRVIAASYTEKSEAISVKKLLKSKKISTWINTLK